MRRFIGLAISLLLLACGLATNSQAVSSVKAGARCVKVNQKVTVGRSVYQCRKSGKYLVWRLIATLPPVKPTPKPSTPKPSSSPTPSPSPSTLPPTGLPAGRLLASSPGLLGLIDRTSDSAPWAQYYGTGLGYKDAFVYRGSTFTLTWRVVNAQGYPMPRQAVTLLANKGWGGSNATFTSGLYTVVNTAGTSDGANIPGITDANGLVSFTLKDTSIRSEPFGTATNVKSSFPSPVYGQFALQIGQSNQKYLSMDIVDIHIVASTPPPSPTPIPSGSVLWSEEFNDVVGTLPSAERWTNLLGNGYDQLGFYNYGTGEIESNTSQNAAYDGQGNLVITTKREGGVWKSARIWTQGKANFQYGKIEIRIKLPSGEFNWPAFWMLGSNYQPPNHWYGDTPWPNSGEIDIVESLRKNSVVQSTIHANYLGTSNPWNGGGGLTAYAPISNVSGEFHTFALLWKPNELAFTLDGVEYGRNTFIGNQVVQTLNGIEIGRFNSNGVWPFNKPFFLILNNAVPPGTSGYSDGTTSTTVVDWIRYSTYDGYGTLNP